jgi:hypothetical protein
MIERSLGNGNRHRRPTKGRDDPSGRRQGRRFPGYGEIHSHELVGADDRIGKSLEWMEGSNSVSCFMQRGQGVGPQSPGEMEGCASSRSPPQGSQRHRDLREELVGNRKKDSGSAWLGFLQAENVPGMAFNE